MSAVAAPFGFEPVFPKESNRISPFAVGSRSGTLGASSNGIASGYAADIFTGSPVILATTGVLQIAAATGAIYGIFAGVDYTDASGSTKFRPNWISGTVASDIVAYAYTADQNLMYRVQSNGSIASTAVGDQANCVNPGTGNAVTGRSTTSLSSTLAGAGVTAQFTIIGPSYVPGNQWGDAFTEVTVKINQSQIGPASVVAV